MVTSLNLLPLVVPLKIKYALCLLICHVIRQQSLGPFIVLLFQTL